MPASTPIYGFTYPCPDEVISPAAFTTLANQIDAKLVELEADRFLALNRFNSDLDLFTTQTITAGVDTTLTLTASTYTLPMSGVYVFKVDVLPQSSPPTISTSQATVHQNGTYRYGDTQNNEGNSTRNLTPVGPIAGVVGDVITTRVFYVGTGTMNVRARMSVKMLVRTA